MRKLVWFSCGAASAVAAKFAVEKYPDVFNKTGWLVGPRGARCTIELKKKVREDYQLPDDIHIFGFTSEEERRVLQAENQSQADGILE